MLNLIVNNGSASKKYSLYRDEDLLFTVHYEKVIDSFIKTEQDKNQTTETPIDPNLFNSAFSDCIIEITKRGFINSEEDLDRIGLRIVAPGIYFQNHHKIDDDFLEHLDDRSHLSPLHIYPVQEEISEIMDKIPHANIYAISDSAFHKNKPDYANIYAYPKDLTKELELYRFGYHGLSVASVVEKLKKLNSLKEKIIICHLGGGSSLTAVKNGQSLDNTMGYSPLEGVPMATRIGNADPNSLFAVMDYKDLEISEVQKFLYQDCGFKGISGLSGDTRVVLKEDREGNKDAKLAIEYYAYEITKTIGSYKTVLGGLDSLVFTGTIGIRSADIRDRICGKLEFDNILLDQSENKLMVKDEGKINSTDSVVEIWVLNTDEMGEMNRILMSLD